VAPMEATVRFVEMVNSPARDIDLVEGALLLAAHADPEFDLVAETARVDDLAAQCSEPTLEGICRLLFDDLGFAGDSDDYYDPANSLLDRVIERRRGLPITLSLLTIEIGKRVGVPLDGVGMPGHFLVRDGALTNVFVDPFSGGTSLSAAECEVLFHRTVGPDVVFDPAYLEPVTGGSILCRMAANLVNAYRQKGDRHGMRWSARLRSRCPGVDPAEQVQLGQALGYSGAFDEAAALLEDAAEYMPSDSASRAVRLKASQFQARLN
jgi:regulator of sirC expression with transglutaminase-like and TPR domain